MFVITADQVNSRATADIVGETISRVNDQFAGALVLPADRTAGDELQLLVANAESALQIILDLTRTGRWSVGCGVGVVNQPMPPGIRESAGGAFVAARVAVDRAKKRQTRFSLEHESGFVEATDTEAFIDLLLAIRARRSVEGWELYDLVTEGLTQAEAAGRLDISPQAASKRAKVADLRAERAAIAPILRAMSRLDLVQESKKGEAP